MLSRNRFAVRLAGGRLGACRVAVALLGYCMISAVFAAQATEPCTADAARGCVTEAEHFAPQGTAVPGVLRQRTSNASAARPVIGLALAGGGTRASHFSMGVMKGLHEANVLAHVDFLSTVSGGGYAGYWYVSQRLAGAAHEDMFRDCIPFKYRVEAQKVAQQKLLTCSPDHLSANAPCLCPSTNFSNVLQASAGSAADGAPFVDPFRYQNHIRGHTDIFTPSFSYATTRKDERLLPGIALPIAGQVLTSLTVDLVGDMLFDWNLNASPSRYLYREGIRRIHGLPPLNCALFLGGKLLENSATRPEECIKTRSLVDQGNFQREPYPLPDFADLRRELAQPTPRIPYWIINATTPVLNCPKIGSTGPCVIKEFLSSNPYPPHKAAFEFTPTHWGAGEFGYWPVDDQTRTFGANTFPLLEAVASSAAFFDPYEKSFTLGGVLNLAQQSTGFKWEDLCALRRSLNLQEFWQANGRRIWHIHFDGLARLEQVCRDGQSPDAGKSERYVYNVWEWTHPVLEGCAVEIALEEYQSFPIDNALSCAALKAKYAAADASRYLNLFLIKTGIDLAKYDEPAIYQQTLHLSAQDQLSRIEIRSFLTSNIGVHCSGKDMVLFPTHSTINLTLDSSAWVYGAYRELAATAARQLRVEGNRLAVAGANTPSPMQPVPVSEMERRATQLTRAFEARAAAP
jgi:hypothetical protein